MSDVVDLLAFRDWKAWRAPVPPPVDPRPDHEKYAAALRDQRAARMADEEARWALANLLPFTRPEGGDAA